MEDVLMVWCGDGFGVRLVNGLGVVFLLFVGCVSFDGYEFVY